MLRLTEEWNGVGRPERPSGYGFRIDRYTWNDITCNISGVRVVPDSRLRWIEWGQPPSGEGDRANGHGGTFLPAISRAEVLTESAPELHYHLNEGARWTQGFVGPPGNVLAHSRPGEIGGGKENTLKAHIQACYYPFSYRTIPANTGVVGVSRLSPADREISPESSGARTRHVSI